MPQTRISTPIRNNQLLATAYSMLVPWGRWLSPTMIQFQISDRISFAADSNRPGSAGGRLGGCTENVGYGTAGDTGLFIGSLMSETGATTGSDISSAANCDVSCVICWDVSGTAGIKRCDISCSSFWFSRSLNSMFSSENLISSCCCFCWLLSSYNRKMITSGVTNNRKITKPISPSMEKPRADSAQTGDIYQKE